MTKEQFEALQYILSLALMSAVNDKDFAMINIASLYLYEVENGTGLESIQT